MPREYVCACAAAEKIIIDQRTNDTDSFDREEYTEKVLKDAVPWLISMACIGTASTIYRVIETVRPFKYASKYNSTLKEALDTKNVSITVLPSFTVDNNAEVALGCRINF